jgi:uncharacterized protein YjcR
VIIDVQKYKLAKADYENGMSDRMIAEKYKVALSTVKRWKSRYWKTDDETVNNNTSFSKKQIGEHHNKQVIRGPSAKWLPEETWEILQEVSQAHPSDILWNNIMIQYTAILRAQKIMYVEHKDDLSSDRKKWAEGETSHSEEYALQYAWEKQANFMNAQSRAMTTLSSLIKQFIAITDKKDERRKKLEMINVQIDVAKAKLKKINTEQRPAKKKTKSADPPVQEQTIIVEDIPDRQEKSLQKEERIGDEE